MQFKPAVALAAVAGEAVGGVGNVQRLFEFKQRRRQQQFAEFELSPQFDLLGHARRQLLAEIGRALGRAAAGLQGLGIARVNGRMGAWLPTEGRKRREFLLPQVGIAPGRVDAHVAPANEQRQALIQGAQLVQADK